MKSLLIYLKNYKKEIIIGPILKLVEAIIEVLIPFFIGKFIDNMFEIETSEIIKFGLCLLILVIIGGISALNSQYFAAKASQGYGTNIRKKLFNYIGNFTNKQIDKISTQRLTNIITNDVVQLEVAVAMWIRLVIRVPFICIGALIMCYIIDPQYAFIIFICMIILSIFTFFIVKKGVPLYKLSKEKLDILSTRVKENLQNVRVVRAFTGEKDEARKFKNENKDTYNYTKKSYIVSGILNPITTLILNITIVIILYFGQVQINFGKLSQGELIAIINYISQMLLAIIVFSNLITIYARAYTSAKRVKSVLDFRLNEDEGDLEFIDNGEIDIKNVKFSYDNIPLLNNFNLKVNEGEILGIIGGAGSGKSTILNLINRSYDIQSGSILIGKNNIKEYKRDFVKQNVLLILQKPDFFRESIKENIILGRENITDNDVIVALKKANAWEFIEKLPDGINTVLENNANNFSGGQKQRIAIARSFIGNPKIILLDDITSALDRKTEKEVLDSIYKYVKENKITTIISSQKLSAFKYADRILVLKDGKIDGIGTKEELEKISETYKEIKNLQIDEK